MTNYNLQFSDFGSGDIERRRQSDAGMQSVAINICRHNSNTKKKTPAINPNENQIDTDPKFEH